MDSDRGLGKDGVVAAPNPKTASRRLLEAAAAERAALRHDLRALEDRRLILQSELRALEISEREMRRRLALVDELAGSHQPRGLRAVPDQSDEPREMLRGAAIREAAVSVVARSDEPDRPRHYTEWFEAFLAAGFGISGRDPLATFLTQLGRSPVVRRDAEPGVYRLHLGAVSELEGELMRLNGDLSRLQHGQQTIEEITSVQEERDRVTREIDRVARALREAIRAVPAAGEGIVVE